MISITVTGENTAALYKDLRELFNADETAKPAKVAKKTNSEVAQPTIEAPAVSTPSSPITLDDIKVVITKVLAKAGKDKLVALLAQYGVKKGSELKEGQYAEFMINANLLA